MIDLLQAGSSHQQDTPSTRSQRQSTSTTSRLFPKGKPSLTKGQLATTALLALAASLPLIFASPAPSAAEDCGPLGVMSSTDAAAQAGISPADIRKCKEHPLSLVSRRDAADATDATVFARDCWWGDNYGCTDGYCWEKCNPEKGHWCWTAWGDGFGDWRKCKGKGECEPVKNAACGQGNCEKCGCSC